MNTKAVKYIIKGFTLAEVLITLAIIGVIAAMTIPALTQNIQEAQFRTAFKEKYSVFSQAFTQMRNDNGGTLENVFISTSHTSFSNNLKRYLNIISYSSSIAGSTNADWHDYSNYKFLNNNSVNWDYKCTGCPSATFSDGSFFMINLTWASNDLTVCNQGGTYPRQGLCFGVMFDVNGRQSPNVIGRDIFLLSVYKDKTVPNDWDLSGSVDRSSCSSSGTGAGCAIQYMMQ